VESAQFFLVPQSLTANRIHFAENCSRAASTDVESAQFFLVPQSLTANRIHFAENALERRLSA
jgi:hypothetical protein